MYSSKHKIQVFCYSIKINNKFSKISLKNKKIILHEVENEALFLDKKVSFSLKHIKVSMVLPKHPFEKSFPLDDEKSLYSSAA